MSSKAASLPFALAGAVVVLGSLASAQSLVRLQGPGGRQMPSGIHVAAFSADGRHFLCDVPDGYLPGDASGWQDPAWYDTWTGNYYYAISLPNGVLPDEDSSAAATTAGNRYVLFTSVATNLGPVHQNGMADVFLYDGWTGAIAHVSVTDTGGEPDESSYAGELSADGRYVVFSSEATDILPGDANGGQDMFVRDMLLGTTELVSATPAGGFPDGPSASTEISADGRFVAFGSGATDLVAGDTNACWDLFVRDRQSGTTERVVMGLGGVQPNGNTGLASMTPSGGRIVFQSDATNLVAMQVGTREIYVLERSSGAITLLSRGLGGAVASGQSWDPRISDDGNWALFTSAAANLVLDDGDADHDAFKVEIQSGAIEIVSRATWGGHGNVPAGYQAWLGAGTISATGRYSVFYSNLTELVAGDTNSAGDTFVWNESSGAGPIVSYCTAKTNSLGCTPRITSGGEPRATGPEDAFFLSVHDLRNNRPGIFLWSLSPAALPFFGGTLCVGAPTSRTPGQSTLGSGSGDDCTGTASFHMSQAYMLQRGLGFGTTAYAQFWGRDPGFAPPDAVTLSDALSFTVGP